MPTGHYARKPRTSQGRLDAIVAAYLAGATPRQASLMFGTDGALCANELKRRGIKVQPRKNVLKFADRMAADYEAGMTCREIGLKYGFSCPAAVKAIKSSGLELRPPRLLTLDEERSVIDLYAGGATLSECGSAFGVSMHVAQMALERNGIKRREPRGHEFGIRVSAAAQGISVKDWAGYAVSPWDHFKTQPEYVQWRSQVFRKQQFTCVDCGQVGGKLHVHHIWPKAKYPQLALDLGNGAVMCEGCHDKLTKKEEVHAERLLTRVKSNLRPIMFYEAWPLKCAV